jgi:hypothetical protein
MIAGAPAKPQVRRMIVVSVPYRTCCINLCGREVVEDFAEIWARSRTIM